MSVNDLEIIKDGALGDVYYRSASGLLLPVGGARGAGNLLTDQASGIPLWAPPASGSARTGTRWDRYQPPAVANALDVEFASDQSISAWPAGWSVQGGGDFQNPLFPSSEAGRFSAWHNAAGWRGRYAACPAAGTDFSFAACVANFGSNSSYSLIAISVGNATTIESGSSWHNMMAGYHAGGGATPGIYIERDGFTSLVAWGPQHVAMGVVMYVRRVGTDYYYGWSYDGQRGVETGPHTLGAAPPYMLIGAYNDRTASTALEVIYWVRHVSGVGMGARRSWGGLI